MIERVWGKADNIELEFRQVNGKWLAGVPPDLSDGQYAAVIYARNSGGETAMWTGILYMNGGIACLHIGQERFTAWLQPEPSFAVQPERIAVELKAGCRCA